MVQGCALYCADMSTILMDLQPFAQIYADLLSDIFKMVVSIVDEEMTRVAGSNRYMSKEIRRRANVAHESGIMKRAFQEQRVQVVEHPRSHPTCQDCTCQEACCEMFNISVPIVVDQRVYGGIALIAMTERQQKRAVRNKELYLSFLQQFAHLLAMKALNELEKQRDHSVLQLMESIIERVDIGVIAFGAGGEIALVNAAARGMLQMETAALPMPGTLEVVGGSEGSYTYALTLGQQVHHLRGTLYRVDLRGYSDILMVQDVPQEEAPQPDPAEAAEMGVQRIAGGSPPITAFRTALLRCAPSSASVLIYGENGTEIPQAALAIHEESARKGRAFFSLRCMPLDEARLSRQLFGAAGPKGGKGRPGAFERAAGGTLYLEDIDKLPLEVQASLLQVLEQGVFRRVNGSRPVKTDVRLIVSSERELEPLARQGLFLKPLYYLLSVLTLRMPPLRERGDDVTDLARTMLEARLPHSGLARIAPDFWRTLRQYPWPGNLLELRGKMDYIADQLTAGGRITGAALQLPIPEAPSAGKAIEICLESLK